MVLAVRCGVCDCEKVRTLLDVVKGIGSGVVGGLLLLELRLGDGGVELPEEWLSLLSCSMYSCCCCFSSSAIDWRNRSDQVRFGGSGSVSMASTPSDAARLAGFMSAGDIGRGTPFLAERLSVGR